MEKNCGLEALGAIEATSKWGHMMIGMDFSQTPKGYAPEQLLKHFEDFANATGKFYGVLQAPGEWSLPEFTKKYRSKLEETLRLPNNKKRKEELTNILQNFIRTVEGESFATALDDFEKCLKGESNG